jgi:uncharacterized membrane protein
MTSTYLIEFGNLLLRWLHVIAAIAWIGESIYFVMLDNSLRPPAAAQNGKHGVFGEMWAVHGGGFYHNQKYLTSPAELPHDLHWSFWKAYTTWLSGFALFFALYLLKPDLYLVNTTSPWAWVATLAGWQAGALAVMFLLAGWLVYDQLCRRISPAMQRDGLLALAVAAMMMLVAWLATQLFQGRAAFLLTGAVMATCMSANVFFWIIPGQRRMVKALKAGQAPNPLDGKRGKQRSVHNTYFTLPVVLLMLSNHYAFTYSSPHAWAVMSLFIIAGALIRQYFVMRHSGRNVPAYPAAGVALLVAAAWLAAPASAPALASAENLHHSNLVANVHSIVEQRCVQCHAARPSQPGFASAPLGIMLDTPAQVQQHAEQIKQVVGSGYMPLGNITHMTDAERAVIARWNPDTSTTAKQK